ncbi:unnamed protein product, partial [Mesorhabditis spiculigera]
MAAVVAICFFLTILPNSQSIDLNSITASDPTTTPSSTISGNSPSSVLLDLDADLEKITSFCMTNADYEKLWDYNLKYGLARIVATVLMPVAAQSIGREELRRALKMPPPPPWKSSANHIPSADELANATTIEAYFELRELVNIMISSGQDMFANRTLLAEHAIVMARPSPVDNII